MKSEDEDKYIYEFTKNIHPNKLGGSIINYVEKLKLENKALKEQLCISGIVCINPSSKYLTNGKKYKIIHNSLASGYYVKNDIGKIAYYSKKNFTLQKND